MITYCGNPIKLVYLSQIRDNLDLTLVKFIYLLNGRSGEMEIRFFDWNDNGVFGAKNTRILNEISRLSNEQDELKDWRKKNG